MTATSILESISNSDDNLLHAILISNYGRFVECLKTCFRSMAEARPEQDGYMDSQQIRVKGTGDAEHHTDLIKLYGIYADNGFPVPNTPAVLCSEYMATLEVSTDGLPARVALLSMKLYRLNKVQSPKFLSSASSVGFSMQPHKMRTWMKGGFAFYLAGSKWEANQDSTDDTDGGGHCVVIVNVAVEGKMIVIRLWWSETFGSRQEYLL